MSAPKAVVQAVMDRLGCLRGVDRDGGPCCETHHYRWLVGVNACPHAEAATYAAYAATLTVLSDLIREDSADGDSAREALGLSWDERRDWCEWRCDVRDYYGEDCRHRCRTSGRHDEHECSNGHTAPFDPKWDDVPAEHRRLVSEWEDAP